VGVTELEAAQSLEILRGGTVQFNHPTGPRPKR
jgi:hypothetical protein